MYGPAFHDADGIEVTRPPDVEIAARRPAGLFGKLEDDPHLGTAVARPDKAPIDERGLTGFRERTEPVLHLFEEREHLVEMAAPDPGVDDLNGYGHIHHQSGLLHLRHWLGRGRTAGTR